MTIPLFWRLKKQKYILIGNKCEGCNEVFFPPRIICPNCRRDGIMNDIKLSGIGKIFSFTVIRIPPSGFEDITPYVIGVIQLKEGPLISGQIINKPEEVEIGKNVRTVFRKITENGKDGVIHYGFKFEIIE